MSWPVLRVAQIVTTLSRGGAQATVLESRQMASHGIEVTILAGPDDPGEGTHWAELRQAGAAVIEVPFLRRPVDPPADLRALACLTGWLRANRPDVVHTHSAKAGVVGRLAAAMAGIPAVHTVHGWTFAALGAEDQPSVGPWSDLGPWWSIQPWWCARQRSEARARLRAEAGRRAVIVGERGLAHLSRALVVVSPVDAETGLAHGIGRPEQYWVVRSGIDLSQPRSSASRRGAVRAELGWTGRFVVGTVARLAPQKDLATLIGGFAQARMPGGLLVIVGDGPQRQALETLASQSGAGDRICFLGQRHDAVRIVAGFDIFALTSRWEGLPRSMVEAAAAGVPVVATGVGSVPEVIRPGQTGTLIPVADPGALAAVLTSVATHPAGIHRMAQRAASEVEMFSAHKMRSDLARLWFEVATGTASGDGATGTGMPGGRLRR
jgi:glycosyltransferase involved in cell wall biosynthesis